MANQYKSVSFPHVKTIMLEEYICAQNKYLKNEPEKLISLCETIFRHRDNGRIICLGNNISQFNPYFDYFNLNNHYKTEFTHYKAKSVQNTTYGSSILSNKALRVPSDDFSYVDKMKSVGKEPFINLIINGHEVAAFFANEKLFIKKRES
ncbi:hypothetical protein ABID23_001337 [Bartonella silvatica]|uniref:Uncharacterized protein n=2 Tax=Bartonella silvatica TaxID=357760 RepID=A0ABV2HI54_9HYPH